MLLSTSIPSVLAAFHISTAAALSDSSGPLRPLILADTNRDGVVNHLDALPDKHLWTDERGAIFLPNIGDSTRRCAAVDLTGHPLSNAELAACNDASGDTLITPRLAAPIWAPPLEGLSKEAVGRIYTEPAATLGRVRIFWKKDGSGTGGKDDDPSQWILIDPSTEFNATSLSQGLTLAIDARELVYDSSVWDGSATVVFKVNDGQRSGTDAVAMKQAPVLVHHHLQQPQTVISADTMPGVSRSQPRFLRQLRDTLGRMNANLPLVLVEQATEVWAQDWVEPGFASMPGPNGTVVSLRVLLRSAQSGRPDGRRVFEKFRGPGVGGWQPGLGSGFGFEEINSGGNIETIPPYTSRDGVAYPNGRVVMTKHFNKYPAESFVKFLKAQRSQTPLFVEGGWLAVGHTDEMIQFLPYDNDLGFTIGIADTAPTLNILKQAQQDGHGSTKVVSYNGSMAPDTDAYFLFPGIQNITIDQFLSSRDFIEANEYAQKYLDSSLELLLREIPLLEKDIIRIPSLWYEAAIPSAPNPDGSPQRLDRAPPGEKQVTPFIPSVINGVVLGSDYLAPKPWGPVIGGKDVFEEAAVEAYARANMRTWFIDDYSSHHVRGGEVHCGTNTFRETEVAWWRSG